MHSRFCNLLSQTAACDLLGVRCLGVHVLVKIVNSGSMGVDGQGQVMPEASPSADSQTEGQLPLKLGRGRSQGTSKKKQGVLAEHAVNWADAQVSALQVHTHTHTHTQSPQQNTSEN